MSNLSSLLERLSDPSMWQRRGAYQPRSVLSASALGIPDPPRVTFDEREDSIGAGMVPTQSSVAAASGSDTPSEGIRSRPTQRFARPPAAKQTVLPPIANDDDEALSPTGPSAANAMKALQQQSAISEIAPDIEEKPRRSSLADGPIAQMLKGETDDRDMGLALSKAGFAMAASNKPFLGALGEGGSAGVSALMQARNAAKARQAQAVGFVLQQDRQAEQERSARVNEAERARHARATEELSKGNLELAQGKYAWEQKKYDEGKGDAKALILARIAAQNAHSAYTQMLAKKAMRPTLSQDDEGNLIGVDLDNLSADRILDADGNPVKLGAKPGAKRAPTKAQLTVQYLEDAGKSKEEIADILSGKKQPTAKDIETLVEKRIGHQVMPGVTPQKQIDEMRAAARREIEGHFAPEKPAAGAAAAPAPGGAAKPATKKEFDELPKGALYVNPADGKTYRKN